MKVGGQPELNSPLCQNFCFAIVLKLVVPVLSQANLRRLASEPVLVEIDRIYLLLEPNEPTSHYIVR